MDCINANVLMKIYVSVNIDNIRSCVLFLFRTVTFVLCYYLFYLFFSVFDPK